jgi:adenosylcobinamide-GDP ribazoletransferase
VSTAVDGLRLALTWLTVLPVRVRGPVDRKVGAAAIAAAPLVGVALGCLAAGLGWVLVALAAPPLLVGVVVVGALALATRGMHLDGLADTVDGLGCYGPPERALAVMRDGGTGPFAVVALVVVLGAQMVSVAALAVQARWLGLVVAVALGRVAFGWACRRGVGAARREGLGALVAGSQPTLLPLIWMLAAAVAATGAVPGRWWQGPVAVVVAAVVVAGFCRHAVRRFGGVSGDVLGACCELAATTAVVVLALG